MTPRLLAAALLLAAGCGEKASNAPASPAPPAAPTAPSAPAAPAASALALDAEGLRLVYPASGATRALAFGTPAAELLAILQRAGRAAPERSTNDECGAGPLAFATWPDGLQLVFQEDRFAGWSTREGGRGLETMSGVGVGSTLGELKGAYETRVEETTLGLEFQAGGLGGLLSGPGDQARITNFWAGVTCAFR